MTKRSKLWWSQVRASKVLQEYKISGTDFDEDAPVPYLYEQRRFNNWKIVITNNGKKYHFGYVDTEYKEEGALLIACIFKEGLQYTDGAKVNQFVNMKMKPWLERERQKVKNSVHSRKKRKLTEDTSEEEYTSEEESDQEYFEEESEEEESEKEESEEDVEEAMTTEEEASDEEIINLNTTTDTTADVPLRLCAPRLRIMLAELEKGIFGSAKNEPFDLRIRELEKCFKLQPNGSFEERIFAIQAKADFHC